MANMLSNGPHEKIMICFIIMLYYYVMLLCYITKSRLDVQFVKKILLEMVISQQMKEEGYNQYQKWF